jgi:hypothetical protein
MDVEVGGGGGGIEGGNGGGGIDGGELAEREEDEDRVDEELLVFDRVERRVRLNWLNKEAKADGFCWLEELVRVEVVDEVHRGAGIDVVNSLVGLLIELALFWDWIVCIKMDCFNSQGGLYSFDSSMFFGCIDCPWNLCKI